ncbi:ATP-binding cassette sub-family D member 3 [Bufo bufo]|uniref:ATP-binding cassette sub-family D member 3 n=1 Tax=Bufo bufo TaxID=8384 RepID=UPI001ABDC276|nr:ATP-binding cassette sub-family D member 3 [Bufo bufo]
MAPVYSKYLTVRNSSAAGAALVLLYLLRRAASGKKNGKTPGQNNEKEGKKEKAVVDRLFFARIGSILKILVPKTLCKETGYLTLIAIMLVARTYCDIWMIQNGTFIESAIIGRSRKDFKKYLLNFMAAMPAISLVNNFLKLGLNELKLCFRERLTKHLYDEYLKSFTYYKMGNLDNRIANADQLLTQDVEKFCNSVVDLYSNLSKPFLDIVLYIFKLTNAIGAQGPASMMAYLLVSGLFLTRLRRPIGKMTITEQRYEGEYRYVNSRLITNSEEIAFYNGNRREKLTIYSAFHKLVDHLHKFIFFRFSMGFVDDIIAKYFATVVGYLVVSRPFLAVNHPRHLTSSHAELLEDYYQSGRMLLRMSQALGRIVLAGREMTRLSGFTARITELMQVLKELNQGKYERTMVSQQERGKHLLPRSAGPPPGPEIYCSEIMILCGDQRSQQQSLIPIQRRRLLQVLKEYLDNVQLGQILDREGGWDIVQDWMDVLSGGEKQRMAMARLFYHKPQFAILDECTSAVSVDVEDYIYSHCKKVGITLFTVSHRKSLWKHHKYYLHMDGRGNYDFKPITDETIEFGS